MHLTATGPITSKRWLYASGETDPPEVPEGFSAPEGSPTSSWLKADIQTWLTENEIEWDSGMTKDELLALVPEE
jgi:hypothetical protein